VLREAREEVRIDEDWIEVLGRLGLRMQSLSGDMVWSSVVSFEGCVHLSVK